MFADGNEWLRDPTGDEIGVDAQTVDAKVPNMEAKEEANLYVLG